MSTLILYHAFCRDGLGAAYSAYKYYGDNAEYRPLVHTELPDSYLLNYEIVYFVDIAPPTREWYKYLLDNKVNFKIIDHHKTNFELASEILGDNLPEHFVYDINKSGAVLTWEYFHKKEVPQILKHIQDRDIHKYQLENTKEITEGILALKLTYKNLDSYSLDELKEKGVIAYNKKMDKVKELIKDYSVVTFENTKFALFNIAKLATELSIYLFETNPDLNGVICYSINSTHVKFELRARTGSGINVGEIAKKYGGGGHEYASGFSLTKEEAVKLF